MNSAPSTPTTSADVDAAPSTAVIDAAPSTSTSTAVIDAAPSTAVMDDTPYTSNDESVDFMGFLEDSNESSDSLQAYTSPPSSTLSSFE